MGFALAGGIIVGALGYAAGCSAGRAAGSIPAGLPKRHDGQLLVGRLPLMSQRHTCSGSLSVRVDPAGGTLFEAYPDSL